MREISLDAMVDDFDLSAPPPTPCLKAGTVTTWLNEDDKARYDRLQDVSGGKFGRQLRELIRAAIRRAEAKRA